jgi:hypothetical protein
MRRWLGKLLTGPTFLFAAVAVARLTWGVGWVVAIGSPAKQSRTTIHRPPKTRRMLSLEPAVPSAVSHRSEVERALHLFFFAQARLEQYEENVDSVLK